MHFYLVYMAKLMAYLIIELFPLKILSIKRKNSFLNFDEDKHIVRILAFQFWLQQAFCNYKTAFFTILKLTA